jgi:hypothetical protein
LVADHTVRHRTHHEHRRRRAVVEARRSVLVHGAPELAGRHQHHPVGHPGGVEVVPERAHGGVEGVHVLLVLPAVPLVGVEVAVHDHVHHPRATVELEQPAREQQGSAELRIRVGGLLLFEADQPLGHAHGPTCGGGDPAEVAVAAGGADRPHPALERRLDRVLAAGEVPRRVRARDGQRRGPLGAQDRVRTGPDAEGGRHRRPVVEHVGEAPHPAEPVDRRGRVTAPPTLHHLEVRAVGFGGPDPDDRRDPALGDPGERRVQAESVVERDHVACGDRDRRAGVVVGAVAVRDHHRQPVVAARHLDDDQEPVVRGGDRTAGVGHLRRLWARRPRGHRRRRRRRRR